ncbi:uncharacterized protein LOC142548965 [Primulina tabacum]|uniref:uncharacterized protein LOC142548965 n=1 Tax=Primulina tabacum TaxID=48773 RepID=UPI003F5A6249
MESEHVQVNNDRGKKDIEIKHDEGKPVVGKNNEVSSPCSPSRSSSSSSSSSRSSIEFDTGEKVSLDNISTKSKSDGNLSSSPEFISSPDTSTHSKSQTSPLGSWQMKSPPTQTMGQPANYDPNRIPSHIFSTKPTTTTDWSVASNESLFSIHMGNNSFSRDNAILFGKSGELPPWVEEWNNNSSSILHYASEPKPSEFSSSLPPVMEVPAHEENDVKSAKVPKVLEKEDSDKVPKVPAGGNVKNHAKETITPVEEARHSAAATSASLPRLSDESGNSGSSFAFPVFASESGKSRSLKVITEKQEKIQTQSHGPNATTPKASETRWFSCVFCWPRCC